jgi:hypothetical protein
MNSIVIKRRKSGASSLKVDWKILQGQLVDLEEEAETKDAKLKMKTRIIQI